MVKKEDCRDCVWCTKMGKDKYYCEVEKTPLQVDASNKMKPPASCHYSVDWRK